VADLENTASGAVEQAVSKKYGYDAQYNGYTHHPAIGIGFCGTDLVMRVDQSKKVVRRVQSQAVI
jgi:hypothetical protein